MLRKRSEYGLGKRGLLANVYKLVDWRRDIGWSVAIAMGVWIVLFSMDANILTLLPLVNSKLLNMSLTLIGFSFASYALILGTSIWATLHEEHPEVAFRTNVVFASYNLLQACTIGCCFVLDLFLGLGIDDWLPRWLGWSTLFLLFVLACYQLILLVDVVVLFYNFNVVAYLTKQNRP